MSGCRRVVMNGAGYAGWGKAGAFYKVKREGSEKEKGRKYAGSILLRGDKKPNDGKTELVRL